jgi:SAM-dependent methyltransferase
MSERTGMHGHFARISEVYHRVRTTDEAPILYIRDQLAHRTTVTAADIGCGTGRYDLLLFRHLPNLRLACIDMSREMLDQLSQYLAGNGVSNFETIAASVEEMAFDNKSLDCVFSFNAVHHFDFPTFIAKAGCAIRADGQIFVYTRTPDQNAGSVWGKHFPGFREKETRLYRLEEMERWIGETGRLRLMAAKTFRYARTSSLEHLLSQARNRHYSTLSLYTEEEFAEASNAFEKTLRRRFDDPWRIEWHDENILLQVGRANA